MNNKYIKTIKETKEKRKNIMTEEELKKELKIITKKLKPNPNNFIIIDKWNYRLVEEYISQHLETTIKQILEEFVNIKDI